MNFLKKSGQHLISYIVLLTLVMAGILVIGPYVVRSWNANLKGWEDSVIDSMQDPILDPGIGTITIQGCDPKTWDDVDCNAGVLDPCTGNLFSCGVYSLLQTRAYSPAGCQCDGTNFPPDYLPLPATEYLNCDTTNGNGCCDPWTPVVPAVPGDCGAPCQPGEFLQTRNCDVSNSEQQCAPSASCNFTCNTPPDPTVGLQPPYGAMCANDDTGLPSNLNWTIVASAGCTATKCQWRCDPLYSVIGATCGVCATNVAWPCSPPVLGNYERGTCPPGQYKPCC